MAEMTRPRVTAAEFEQLPETNTPTELIEAELIVSPSPVPKHQPVSGETYHALRDLIPNARLFYAPIEVYDWQAGRCGWQNGERRGPVCPVIP